MTDSQVGRQGAGPDLPLGSAPRPGGARSHRSGFPTTKETNGVFPVMSLTDDPAVEGFPLLRLMREPGRGADSSVKGLWEAFLSVGNPAVKLI